MIFTPEERRALLAFGAVLVFGQLLSWYEGWRVHAPDRELAAWLDQVDAARAAADSASTGNGSGHGATAEPGSGAVSSSSGVSLPDVTVRTDPSSAAAPPAPRLPKAVPAEPISALPPGILETGRLRLDLATAEDLTSLPGIGPALAARIVAAREEAPFRTVEDLRRVKGIGAKTLERLRPHLSVESLPGTADSSRGEQRVDAAESGRRTQAGTGRPHQ
ncbi:MAG: helix-hairpin-helix domain-containing protein [Candidatus Eisenbacteria bacterium]